MFCSQCGGGMQPQMQFCTRCGWRVGTPPRTAQQGYAQPQGQPPAYAAQAAQQPGYAQHGAQQAGYAPPQPVQQPYAQQQYQQHGYAPQGYQQAPMQPAYPVPGAGVQVAARPARKTGLIIAVLLVVAAGVAAYFLLFSKSDEQKIDARLQTFAAAYTAGDFDKLVGCFDPQTRSAFNMAASIGSSMGVNVSDLFATVMGVGPVFYAGDATIAVTVHEIRLTSETTARADITFHFGGSGDRLTLDMMKSGSDWFIDMRGYSIF